jgi:RNA polymerase-binding protein DksA
MNSTTKTKIVGELEEELETAQHTLQKVETQLQDNPDAGLGEGATGFHSWEMALARRDRVRQKIEELQETLVRVQDNNYGRCETCGRAIDPERLEILPTTTQCARCANL